MRILKSICATNFDVELIENYKSTQQINFVLAPYSVKMDIFGEISTKHFTNEASAEAYYKGCSETLSLIRERLVKPTPTKGE